MQSALRKFNILLITGAGLILLAVLWDLVHPIIKHIWTGSFVLFAGGLCFLLMALFYGVIDMLKYQKWSTGFVIIGSNAIFAYMASHLFDFGHVADIFTTGLQARTGEWYTLIQTTVSFLILFLILRHMYRYKIFIKV